MSDWISVADRLPDPHTPVLTWVSSGHHYVDVFHPEMGDGGAFYEARSWDQVVTHWMPLPPPPRRRVTKPRVTDPAERAERLKEMRQLRTVRNLLMENLRGLSEGKPPH